MQYLGSISGLISSQSPGVLFFDEVLDEDLPNVKDCLVDSVLVRARTCSGANNRLNPIRGQASESTYYYTYLKHGRVDTNYFAGIYEQMVTCTELGLYTSNGTKYAWRTAHVGKRVVPGSFMLNPLNDDHIIRSPRFAFSTMWNNSYVSIDAFYLQIKQDKTPTQSTLKGGGTIFVGGTNHSTDGLLPRDVTYIDFPIDVRFALGPNRAALEASDFDGLMSTDDKITTVERITLTSALVCAKEFCMKLSAGTNFTVDQNLVPGHRPSVKWANTFEPVNL